MPNFAPQFQDTDLKLSPQVDTSSSAIGLKEYNSGEKGDAKGLERTADKSSPL